MTSLRVLFIRLRAFLTGGGRDDARLSAEVEAHLELLAAEHVQRGLSPSAALEAARRDFGGVEQMKDTYRDRRGLPVLETVAQDLRDAFRSFRAARLVTLIAISSLALGIGANTAIFSLINSLLLRPLPVRDPYRLAIVSTGPGFFQQFFSYATFEHIDPRRQFTDGALVWAGPSRLNLARSDQTEQVDALWVSGTFFDTLGVPASIGRMLRPSDDVRGGGADGPVAVVSYRMWRERLGGDLSVVGRPLVIERTPITIVGVAPASFFGVEVGGTFDVALPAKLQPVLRRADGASTEYLQWLRMMLRLKPDLPLASAAAALRAAQPDIRAAAMPTDPRMRTGFLEDPLRLETAALGTSSLRPRYERPLWVLLAIGGLVLLMGCANIANLLLARASGRHHEISMRLALGASRWRLRRQLVIESAVLALVGAILGLVFAEWASRMLVQQLPAGTRQVALDLALDWRVLTFTAAVMVGTVLLFGVAPAIRMTRVLPIDALKEWSRGATGGARTSVSNGVVVMQVAVSLILAIAMGLFIGTLHRLTDVPRGFDEERVLVVNVDAARASRAPENRMAFYQDLAATAAAVPGVAHAGGSVATPMAGPPEIPVLVTIPGAETLAQNERLAQVNGITPGWIDAYSTPLRAGRDIDARDTGDGPRVALVNEAFARKFLAGKEAIGAPLSIAFGTKGEVPFGSLSVIGIVGDAVQGSLRTAIAPRLYLPLLQWGPVHPTVRYYISVKVANGRPETITRSLFAALRAVDGSLELTSRPLADQVRESLAQEQLVVLLSGSFGVLGLFLAGLGLYGVIAYAVSRRRDEIGIRLALGALPSAVVRLLLTRVAALVGLGIMLGLGTSVYLSRFVEPLLFGLGAQDPIVVIGAIALVGVVGALAAWVPAAAASTIDPAQVLRDS